MLNGQDPEISVTSGTVGVSGMAGNFNIGTNIPIGATFKCNVVAPEGSGLHLNTVTWAGLGNLGSYLTGSSDNAPPQSMKPSAPVLNKAGTQFVVVQPNTQYTIKATVTYTNAPGQWTSSVTFTSGKMPTYQYLGQVRKLDGQEVPDPQPNVSAAGVYIQYTNGSPNKDGMCIEAQTDPSVPGNYMLMQTSAMLLQFKGVDKNIYQLANPAGGPQAFDNGAFGGTTNTLGQQVAPVSNAGNFASTFWTEPPGPNQIGDDFYSVDSAPLAVQNATDKPTAPSPPDQESVGGLNGGTQEMFTTYLMYKPPAPYTGTWVAIGKVTWGFGGTANVQNGTFVQTILKPNTTPAVATPLSAATPTWNTRTTDITANGWQKANQPAFPATNKECRNG